MAGRYIPPHMRDGQGVKTPDQAQPTKDAIYKARDLDEHYQVASGSSLRLSSTNDIVYVPVFYQQHPHWGDRCELFIKSNLEVLPGFPEKYTPTNRERQSGSEIDPNPQTPIPVFAELKSPGGHSGNHNRDFHFAGYFDIVGVDYFEPHSEELIAMQTEKWTTKSGKEVQRERKGWKESLSLRWAVVKLKVSSANLDPPKIQVSQKQEKSVNEMLNEMRMGDGTSNCSEAEIKDARKPIAEKASDEEKQGGC